MLEVPVATLRTWEDRYGQVIPTRNGSGHRLFTRSEVEQLRFIRTRMTEGASVADAHRLLAERAETGAPLAPAARRPAPRLLIQLAESDPYAAEFEEYFLKTEGFEVEVALTEKAAREAFAAATPAIVIVEVLISGGAGLALCRHRHDRHVGALAEEAAQLQPGTARDEHLDDDDRGLSRRERLAGRSIRQRHLDLEPLGLEEVLLELGRVRI